MSEYRSFKAETTISPKIIMSVIASIIGLGSLFFLFAPGATFIYSNSVKGTLDVKLADMVWGGAVVSLSAGLIACFFVSIAAGLLVLAVGGFRFIGYLSFVMFMFSGIVFLCAIPICAGGLSTIGNGYSILAWGSYAVGILQIIAGGLSFFAARGE